jgi:branched-chain amino acid transport system permease protein
MGQPLFQQLLINGLALGCVYALLAVGLSLIFGVMNIVNFAHGALYMLGGYVAFYAMPAVGYWAGLVAAFVALGAIGFILHDLLLARLSGGQETLSRSILVTIGLALVIQNGAIVIWTAQPRLVDTSYSLTSVEVAGFTIPLLRLFAIAITLVVVGGLLASMRWTATGKAVRAVSQNREAALMVGFIPHRFSRLAAIIGIGLGGLAGAVLAPIYTVSPAGGFTVVFKAFAIVVIGGMGSVGGTAVVALLVGVAESLVGGYSSTVLQESLVFVLMILLLFVRPQGLFGRTVRG